MRKQDILLTAGVAMRPILLEPNPFLTERLSEVTNIDDLVRADVAALEASLKACGDAALGLAANQIGVRTKAFSMNFAHEALKDYWETFGRGIRTFINPRITDYYGERHLFDRKNQDGKRGEGCLSTPFIKLPTMRYDHIRFTSVDIDDNELCVEFTGLPAVIVQHETDHPEGRLMWDNVPKSILAPLMVDWQIKLAAIKAGVETPGYIHEIYVEPEVTLAELKQPIY